VYERRQVRPTPGADGPRTRPAAALDQLRPRRTRRAAYGGSKITKLFGPYNAPYIGEHYSVAPGEKRRPTRRQVEWYLGNVFTKLGITSRKDLR
jgi:hypothetical protein